jgi:hypothetical protein
MLASIDGPPNAVTPNRKKDANNCLSEGCESDGIAMWMLVKWRCIGVARGSIPDNHQGDNSLSAPWDGVRPRPLHLFSDVLIGGGFILIGAAWDVLYKAQRARQVATTGPYAYVRHPQYAGFVLILVGFLIQWPTLITLIMFPILVTMYIRLARREEREALVEFGDAYAGYAANTPTFFPRLLRTPSEQPRG